MPLSVWKRATPVALPGAPRTHRMARLPGLRLMVVWWSLNLVALIWTVGLAVVWPRALPTVPPAWAIATNVALFLLPELVVLVWLALSGAPAAAGEAREQD